MKLINRPKMVCCSFGSMVEKKIEELDVGNTMKIN